MAPPLTWKQVTAQAETAATQLLAFLAPKQVAYRKAHGVFWQGVWTADKSPANGVTMAMDRTRKPHDQQETWAAFGATARTLPVRVSVDVMPHAYVLRMAVVWGSMERVKAWAVGDDRLSHDWVDCPEVF